MSALVAVLSCSVLLASSSVQDRINAIDSLGRIHPRMQAKWLSERGIDLSDLYTPRAPGVEGTRMIGKWGRGPSVEVTGRDSLVFLSLGSEVAIVNFSNPDSPQVMSEVQASGLVVQAAVKDSFLYIGANTGVAGLEVWNILNPAAPVFRGRALTRLTDFCVKDTFAYVTMRMSSPARDTFKVYNLADPTNPALVGSCLDSGDAVTVAGNTVIQADWHDLHAIDVSDPANPHRVGTYPGYAISVEARNTICCAGFRLSQSPETHRFVVLDISNPASIHELGRLDDAGAYDICLADTFAYLSGYESDYPLRIVSIADSAHPRLIGSNASLTQSYAMWANPARSFALVADAGYGLAVFNTTNTAVPMLDTQVVAASAAYDVALDAGRAYVASYEAGLQIIDVTDPTRPSTLGNYDSSLVAPAARSCVARDSFAYMPWFSARMFRSVDVTDPAHPTFAGDDSGPGPAEDMVLADTIVYCASYYLAAFNVARPRAPTLIGSCVAGDLNSAGLCLKDTIAYFAGPFDGLKVFSIANPASPRLLTTLSGFRSWGCDVVDTFLLAPSTRDESLHIWNVADPSSPRVVSTVYLKGGGADIKIRGDYAYTGGQPLQIVDIRDPLHPVVIDSISLPYGVRRFCTDSTHVYAACYNAGVCVLDTFVVGLADSVGRISSNRGCRLLGTVTCNTAKVVFSTNEPGRARITVHDAAGRAVAGPVTWMCARPGEQTATVDLADQPAGVYTIGIVSDQQTQMFRVIKLSER
jgi:hypothetical protein